MKLKLEKLMIVFCTDIYLYKISVVFALPFRTQPDVNFYFGLLDLVLLIK